MTAAVAATLVTLGIILMVAWVVGFVFSWVYDCISGWIALPLAALPFVALLWLRLFLHAGGFG